MADTRYLGIVLFPDVEELVGPWQVLAAWTGQCPQDGYAVRCLSRDGGPVRCANGLTVQAHHSFPTRRRCTSCCIPAGGGPAPS